MENRNAYKILVEKPKGKRSPGRPRHRQRDNIKIEGRCGLGGSGGLL
jgi:hypothetical protein